MQKLPFLLSFVIMLIFISTTSVGCKSRHTAADAVVISYTNDIRPLMLNSCTPCHFPERGKKKMLDTYEAVAENIKDIVHRINLPVENEEFMPFKSKKAPLTADEIKVIELWQKQGMPR